MARLKILGVHGLGDHRLSPWKEDWKAAISERFSKRPDIMLEFDFVEYDDLFFDNTNINAIEVLGALAKLGWSGVTGFGRRSRGLFDIPDVIKSTAGYVVAWVNDEGFQSATRDLVLDRVTKYEPDVVLAHSLGSLITYNAFSHPDASKGAHAKALRNTDYVTLGSQIGNPFVVGNLTHGRIQSLAVRRWSHLFNRHDDVFTAEIRSSADNFAQVPTPFDIDGFADHDAVHYLTHSNTVKSVWQSLASEATEDNQTRSRSVSARTKAKSAAKTERKVDRRALLIGIDDYPREQDRLAGCVNDVFSMSAVLQECGFAPEDIRTCLNDRATADGIKNRMEWLFDDVQPGDQRVFYYSGHGARVPEYGTSLEPDRLTETLVPWDFDWSPEKQIADEDIYKLYSQLPYDCLVMLVFDCCHSGSMHRQSGAKARGIAPPDDIRHRQLKWDIDTKMWVDRDFKRLNEAFTTHKDDEARFFGARGATVRPGRAAMLRRDSVKEYEEAQKNSKAPIGPYLPLIIEACGEEQLSYEYRHGATSYGAFTFCLTSLLREEKQISFERLIELAKARLSELQYDQVPQILGPNAVMRSNVPWRTTSTEPKRNAKQRPGSSTPRLSG